MALDMTSFDAALKAHYEPSGSVMKNLVYKDNPLLAMIPKMEKFGGKNLPIPLIYGNPQGRSATFATAIANKTSSKLAGFTLTRNHDYALASIDNETIEASQGDSDAFMEAATVEIDGAIQSATRSLAIALYGTGSGSIGRVTTSSFAVVLCTLTNLNDIVNFEVGMKIVVNDTDDATSVRSGTLTIASVDRNAGTFTTTVNLSTGIAAIAQNDYIFVEGDPGAKVKGLRGWFPTTVATTGDSWFGVDRYLDRVRLAGNYIDGSALPIEEALISGAVRAAREGGKVDHCFVDYSAYDNLSKSLGSKVQYIDLNSDAQIAFRGILINGPRGPIKVVPDQNCPSTDAFMCQLDTIKLYSLGKAPKILDTDGLKMLREASADSVEVRVGYYAQLGCVAPGWNCRVKIA